jgi:hypothetical protein
MKERKRKTQNSLFDEKLGNLSKALQGSKKITKNQLLTYLKKGNR